jgi:hypothetical protein
MRIADLSDGEAKRCAQCGMANGLFASVAGFVAWAAAAFAEFAAS